jgi:hypothetical protein
MVVQLSGTTSQGSRETEIVCCRGRRGERAVRGREGGEQEEDSG